MEQQPGNSHSALVRMLPAAFRRRVEHRPGLIRILDNIGWLFFDKILRMGVGLLVGVWVARYLGPEQFGQLNYAIAFVGLFVAIAELGLGGIVVRDLVRHPDSADSVLGTAFVMQFLGGLLCVILINSAMVFIRPDDKLMQLMVAILSLSLIIKSVDIVKYWFESQVQSKYIVWVENGIFVFSSLIKIFLILSTASLLAFVYMSFIEGFLIALGIIIFFVIKKGGVNHWQPSYIRTKLLLKDSWPLILSGVAVSIYLRIDQIMISELVGDAENGTYSVAVRFSEIFYFFPMTIAASTFPAIIDAKKRTQAEYEGRLQSLYDIMVSIALIISVSIYIVAPYLVVGLFGDQYSGAIEILRVHIWASIFVFLGVACGSYTRTENIATYSMIQTLIGMGVNIALNFMLIPLWGGLGAAWATLISYGVATFSVILFKRTRQNGRQMVRSLNIVRLINKLRMIHV